MAIILAAAPVRKIMRTQLKTGYAQLLAQGIQPCLMIVLVGNDPASVIYTQKKKIFAEKLGVKCEIIHLSETIPPQQFVAHVENLCRNPQVDGCLIQLPLPPQLRHLDVGHLVPPEKDVDGFHPENLYGLLRGDYQNGRIPLPCTPKGIMTLMDHYQIPLVGKQVVMVGRSMIVGKPAALLFSNRHATVTLCHSQTVNLEKICQQADVVVTAIGRPRWMGPEFFRHDQQQVVIDVGINRDDQGEICGDVDYHQVMPLVKAITPVPGGVGPMTIVSLAQNLLALINSVRAAEKTVNCWTKKD